MMKTVKEVSELTGISVRTLHYYDEIGLFKPTEVTEAGYRLYDDKAIDRLGQILVFKELDLPLSDIKDIMDNPNLDRNSILEKQRKMLCKKKQRIERIIDGIDRMMKGEKTMDFTVFSEKEMEDMAEDMFNGMTDKQKQFFIDQFGSFEEWKKQMIASASDEKVQKNWAKVVEWYGSKDAFKEDMKKEPLNSEIYASYQKRLDGIYEKLANLKGTDVNSFDVRKLMGEYDFVAKQLYQMDDVKKMHLDIAKEYMENPEFAKALDKKYGEGGTRFIGEAMEAFYNR